MAATACGSQSSPPNFGDDATQDDDSGSGSGSGTASGSGSGSGSSSGSDAGHVSTPDASPNSPTVITCGSGTCNLKTNTCCVGQDAKGNTTGSCIAHGTTCPMLTVSFNCGGAVDCPSSQVCCGEADEVAVSAQTVCTDSCPTMSSSSTKGQAQVCRGSAECGNQMDCIAQTCLGTANLSLCGLTNQKPFSCVAR
ncbi:MAG TPA: hypothetical protein VH044_05440 [Polyangiaceae bacterium]|nr:hypothetical protein [Polyangiaceae bacterium]